MLLGFILPTGEYQWIVVPDDGSVQDARDILMAKCHVLPSSFTLSFDGTQLDTQSQLQSYGIKNQCRIHVHLERGHEASTAPPVWSPSSSPLSMTPPLRKTAPQAKKRRCYMCRRMFYPKDDDPSSVSRVCPSCAALNEEKRAVKLNLAGRIALVTGARIKVGFHTALRLLRAGASVIALTRFPRDAALRYKATPDYTEWSHRLEVYGVDLRDLPSVLALAQRLLATQPHLDIVVNNAAQTVRRPAAFYRSEIQTESDPTACADPACRLLVRGCYRGGQLLQTDDAEGSNAPALLADMPTFLQLPGASLPCLDSPSPPPGGASLPCLDSPPAPPPGGAEGLLSGPAADDELFPEGQRNPEGQQLDLRAKTSWNARLVEVSPLEVLEAQIVNAVVPFTLTQQLMHLLDRARTAHPDAPDSLRFVINVSSPEGQFNAADDKTPFHPHTNMAKAALNMMTRTCAADLAKSGVLVNSVDPGWVSFMHAGQATFRTSPLTLDDGAARVLDPIAQALRTPLEAPFGLFFQHYQSAEW